MHVIKIKKLLERFDVTENTIWRWVRTTDFPKPFKVNGTTVWDEEEINRWVIQQKEKSHGSHGEAQGADRSDVRSTGVGAEQAVG